MEVWWLSWTRGVVALLVWRCSASVGGGVLAQLVGGVVAQLVWRCRASVGGGEVAIWRCGGSVGGGVVAQLDEGCGGSVGLEM